MALSERDFDSMRLLFRDEVQVLREEMSNRFDCIAQQLDGLYQRDEKREQEYLSLNAQASRLDQRVSALEKKCL